ncbi:hypothetical protein [Alteromonas sp. C1M14]|uniref:hypothetical protein n=1 Tax=Alteromonas sp. C1M14 TaxID=2841567 RepID=UPI001C0A548E|nr:hypothetical protein [Alteromonas sp. C1M14]MBU2977894.1 hypothetical protein [Alteromonas sp. C1M14]
MAEKQNPCADMCKSLLDNPLAGCVVSTNGSVSYFYGTDGVVTANAEDAADIIKLISQLIKRQEERS